MNVNLLQRDALNHPHELFATLRDKGPVVWSDDHSAWIVNDYAGVVDGFRDVQRLSSDRLTPLERRLTTQRRETLTLTFEVLRGWMTFHDAPRHAVLRDPVRRAFTPKRVGDLRPTIERVVVELLDDLPRAGTVIDFKELFAFPVPAIVIAELLGIPAADRGRFKTWSKKLSAIVFGESGNVDQAGTAAQGSAEFHDYFSWLIAERTANPGDDLISALVAARADADTGLTDMEVVGACTLLLFAGHETTTNAITNAVAALLTHPEQARELAAAETPAAVGAAVDELLRYDGPVKIMVRNVATDHERGGAQMRRGETVYLSVIGANHDPSVFDSPHTLDLRRPSKPGHVAFGQGPHFCLGHALARLEMSIAVPAVLRHFPAMTFADEHIEWDPLILIRSAAELPVALVP